MNIEHTTLSFTTDGEQSLWGPGKPHNLSFDTGTSFVFDPKELKTDIDVSALGLGVKAEVFGDFKIGLIAYAKLPSAGGFKSTFDFELDILVDGALDTSKAEQQHLHFDVTDIETTYSSIESTGFNIALSAGLDLVVGAKVGAKDITFKNWIHDVHFDGGTIIDIDKRIELIKLHATPFERPFSKKKEGESSSSDSGSSTDGSGGSSSSTDSSSGSGTPATSEEDKTKESGGEVEFNLGEGIYLIGRLPTGADTKNESDKNELSIHAKGASSVNFIEVKADLDELALGLAKKIPAAAPVAELLGKTVFAKYKFDLHDYISKIPENKLHLEAEVLDIYASMGIHLTEKVTLDVSDPNNKNLPNMSVALRSDNGTPDDTSDDVVLNTTISELMRDDYVAELAAPSTGVGEVTLSATYALENPQFTHAMGTAANFSLTVEALKAKFVGDIVKHFTFDFGPLYKGVFPDGGFEVDLFDFYHDTFGLADGAFNTDTDTYTIFYADLVPEGLDITAPGAEHAIFRYREAVLGNIHAVEDEVGFLWGNRTDQKLYELRSDDGSETGKNWGYREGVGTGTIEGSNNTAIWGGDVDATVDLENGAGSGNFVVARPLGDATSGLRVNLARVDYYDVTGHLDVDILRKDGAYTSGSKTFHSIRSQETNTLFASPTTAVSFADRKTLLDFGGLGSKTVSSSSFASDLEAAAASFKTIADDDYDFTRPDEWTWVTGTSTFGADGAPGSGTYTLKHTDHTFVAEDYAVSYTANRDGKAHTLTSFDAVEVEGSAYNDALLYSNATRDGYGVAYPQFIDGGGQTDDIGDIFVGNFAVPHPNVAINWDLKAAVDAARAGNATGAMVTLANGLTVGNVESLGLRTGDADDTITLAYGKDYVETGGGHDVVTVTRDTQWDEVHLGEGDDAVIVGGLSRRDNETPAYSLDRIYGGEGRDYALHNHSDYTHGLVTWFLNHGIGSRDYLDGLTTALDAHSAILDATTLEAMTRSGDVHEPGGRYLLLDQVLYDRSIEHIGVLGTELADDGILFTGGHSYAAGTSAESDGDLLVGDFGAYGRLLGIDGGLRLAGDGSTASFGDSILSGFDRLVVRGTDFGDKLTGGGKIEWTWDEDGHGRKKENRGDFLDGGRGNDVLDGGADNDRDVIDGGEGDDIVRWRNGGADRIDGGEGVDTLIISADGTERRGLQYATTGTERSATGSFLDANSRDGVLINSLDTVFGPDPDGDRQFLVAFDTAYINLTDKVFGHDFDTLDLDHLQDAEAMSFRGFERVNVTGSSQHSDLIVYQGGATYDGGEGYEDADVFLADFTGQALGIDLVLSEDRSEPIVMRNGVSVANMERLLVRGTDGADTLGGGALEDRLYGGKGDDTLLDSNGNDQLHGEEGRDTFLWNDNDDALYTYDIIDGGAGIDTLVLGSGDQGGGLGVGYNRHPDYSTFEAAGLGVSQLKMADFISAIDPLGPSSAAFNAPSREVEFGTRDNRVYVSNVERVNVSGSDAYDDTVVFMNGSTYWGGERDGDHDIFIANLSSRTEGVSVDFDVADGTEVDFLDGTSVGGFEHYVLRLGSGKDRVVTGDGVSIIYGGEGNDYLESHASEVGLWTDIDTLDGGAGDDVLVATAVHAHLKGGEGHDRAILDFTAGAASEDGDLLLTLGVYSAVDAAALRRDPNLVDHSVLPRLASGKPIEYRGDGKVSLEGIESLRMSLSAEHATSKAGVLVAASGRSELLGGDGDDVLVAYGAPDILFGGAGDDLYVFGSSYMQGSGTAIVGETKGGAELRFSDSSAEDLSFEQHGADLFIYYGLGTMVVARDYYAIDETGLDFRYTVEGETKTITRDMVETVEEFTGERATAGETRYGTKGDDELAGTVGNDVLRGGRGDDHMLGSAGSDIFDGGAGENWVSYHASTDGVRANLNQGRGEEGDAKGDVYIAVTGLVGSATGANQLFGDRYDNTLIGGETADQLEGRAGDDFLVGHGGADQLWGGAGDDMLMGDEGDDILRGGDGSDHLFGGAGDDTLWGSSSTFGGIYDTDAATSVNFMHGGAGNDIAYATGKRGDTYLYGGDDDADTVDIDENGTDTFHGLSGSSTLDLSAYEFAVRFEKAVGARVEDWSAKTGTIDVTSAMTDRMDVDTEGSLAVRAIDVGQFIGTAHDDVFVANAPGARVDLGAGEDLLELHAHQANGAYDGGSGFDRLLFKDDAPNTSGTGLTINNNPFSWEGYGTLTDWHETTYNIIGFEEFEGTQHSDTFDGSFFQSDVFDDHGGADTFRGWGGDDTLFAGIDGANDTYDGGEGFDAVDYSDDTLGIDLDLDIGFEYASGIGIGTDTLTSFERATTGSGDDTVWGSAANNVLDAGGGDDWVFGMGGDDVIIGGVGNDNIDGDYGTDPSVESGYDTVDYRNVSADLVIDMSKTTGQVAAKDGSWADTLVNIEAIRTGDGDDEIRGSDGDDQFVHAAAAGRGGFDTYEGGSGHDVVDFSEFGAAVAIDLKNTIQVSTNDSFSAEIAVPVREAPTPGSSVLGTQSSAATRNVAALSGIEEIILTDFDDSYLGSDGADTMRAGRGDDKLVGRGGDDVIDGGSGSDTVDYSRETGELLLDNGWGIVVNLNGGQSRDTHGAFDTLLRIENAIGTYAGDFMVGSEANNVLVGRDGDDQIFGFAGTNMLEGGRGNDSLFGGRGDDIMLGGEGGDQFLGGAGDDYLDGGNGFDWIDTGAGRRQFLLDGVISDGTTMTGTAAATQAQGTDTLLSIERVDFVDGSVFFGTDSTVAQAYRLYSAALDRAPDAFGLAGWANSLANGMTLDQAARGFVGSAEFQAKYGATDDAQFVTLLYNNVLDRGPDSGGLSYWTGLLGSGAMDRGQVLAGFSESPENVEKTRALVEVGLWHADPEAASAARLYHASLGRAPDAGGLGYWRGQLEQGRTLAEAADGFVGSPEFQSRYGTLDDAGYVDLLYQNVLGRGPDAAGGSYWRGLLDSGAMDRGDVLAGFADSLENQIRTAGIVLDNGAEVL